MTDENQTKTPEAAPDQAVVNSENPTVAGVSVTSDISTDLPAPSDASNAAVASSSTTEGSAVDQGAVKNPTFPAGEIGTSTDAAAGVSAAAGNIPPPSDTPLPELSDQKIQHIGQLRKLEEEFHALLHRIDGSVDGVLRLANEELHQAAIKVMEAVELARRHLLGS